MPDLLELIDYDLFDYKHLDESPLELERAMKKIAQLRSSDPGRFHRIVPTDSTMASFRVESVPREEVYSELLSRWTGLLTKLVFRSAKR